MQPKPCARCAQMPYISPGFICHTEGCRWAITAEMILQPKESEMAEKMSLQQVRDWAAKTPANNGWKAKERDEAVAAIDAHLAHPAKAVDVGAIREVITELTKPDVLHAPYEERCADKLTRAIGNVHVDTANDARRYRAAIQLHKDEFPDEPLTGELTLWAELDIHNSPSTTK